MSRCENPACWNYGEYFPGAHEHSLELGTLDPTIWFQVSRKFRIVARLPEGKTGKQALAECGGQRCDDQAWIDGMGEAHAGDHYLRCYAPKSDHLELTREQFAAFRRSGGGTYLGKKWREK